MIVSETAMEVSEKHDCKQAQRNAQVDSDVLSSLNHLLLHSSHPLFASELLSVSISLDHGLRRERGVQEEWLEFKVEIEIEVFLFGQSYSLVVVLVTDVAEWAWKECCSAMYSTPR